MKNFTLYAMRNEWIEKNPFKSYKMKEEHNKDKDHLTRSELEVLIRKELPNERLERIRDVFAFCCFTGLAFTDADHLRLEHITTDESGALWARKPREKTGVMSRIPLLPHPIKLLGKYRNDPALAATGKMLPIPSYQKMNAYLKEIAGICNIDKTLTTHCARHTFACLAVEYGMPIDVLAKILGHTNTNMTRHYAKFSEKLIGKEMMKIGQCSPPKTNDTLPKTTHSGLTQPGCVVLPFQLTHRPDHPPQPGNLFHRNNHIPENTGLNGRKTECFGIEVVPLYDPK